LPFVSTEGSVTVAALCLNYSIVTPSWLTASPKSGTVTTASKTINFTINSNAPGLQPDTYVNSINFYNTTNNQGNTTRLATLTVNPKQYTITVRASPSADGTVSGGGTFAEGTSHTVTATANSSHTFVHWTENGRVVSTSPSYTFTLPSANVTLIADFH
jgi:Divergent InlB B-repeat domain